MNEFSIIDGQTSPRRGQNEVNLHTTIKTKFGNLMRMKLHRGIFRSFSRPRGQGKPHLKVKVKILKILKLSKYIPHPTFQFEATK